MSNIATSLLTTTTNNNVAATVVAANDATQQPANVTPIAEIKANATEAEAMELQKQRHAAAYERIAKLRDERQTWNDTVYKTSNDMLYGVLQQCYAMYFEMCGKSTTAAALREALAKHLEERKIVVLKSTHTMTKIVRCVFDGDRKRFNTYSRVLQAALAQNKAVNELAQFIVDNGGVDEIYRAKSATALSTADKAAYAATALRDSSLATVDEAAIKQQLDAAKDGEMHVAIVTQRAGGAIEVNAIVFSEGVLKAALAAYYNAHKDAVTATTGNAAAGVKQAEQDVALEELAKQAA
jgi:hypothetical protein